MAEVEDMLVVDEIGGMVYLVDEVEDKLLGLAN